MILSNKYILLVVFFLSGLISIEISYAQSNKNHRASSEDRILNGEVVDGVTRRVEWIFSLRKEGRHICGASFIAPQFSEDGKITKWSSFARSPAWAITAAHCVVERDGSLSSTDKFTMLGGILDISPGISNPVSEMQKVEKIYIPSASDKVGAYSPVTLENDIAILQLSDATKDLDARRRSIRLPTMREVGWIYDSYIAASTAGWGRTETGAASSVLLEVRLPLVDRQFCQNKFSSYGDIIYPGMLCAGFSSGEYDSCQGDSGGPLYYKPARKLARTASPVLLGVVSWGRGCGTSDLFGVYTKISYYEDWIRSIIEAHRNH